MNIDTLITLGVAVVSVGLVNAVVVAFGYGKISAKIDVIMGLPERVGDLENRVTAVEVKCDIRHVNREHSL